MSSCSQTLDQGEAAVAAAVENLDKDLPSSVRDPGKKWGRVGYSYYIYISYIYIYIFRFMCDTDHLVCFTKYMHTNRQFSLRITTWWGHVCPFSGLVSFPRSRKGVMKVLLLHVFWEGNPSKNSFFFQGEFMAFCVRMVVNFIKEKSLQQNEPKIQCNYIKSTKFSN